jgi:hypothetical protein
MIGSTQQKINDESQETPPEVLSDFQIFPQKFEQYLLKHWFLLTVFIPYAALVITGFLYAQIDGTFPSLDMRWTVGILTDWQFVFYMSGYIVSIIPYAIWYRKVPGTFQQFLSNNLLETWEQGHDVTAEYMDFIADYKKHLTGRWRYLPIGICTFMILIFILAVNPYTAYFSVRSDSLLNFLGILHITFMYVIAPLMWAYLAGVAAWTLVATGKYIREIPRRFKLKIKPSHPDKSGGLRFLGRFSFMMALPLLIGTVFISMIGIGGGEKLFYLSGYSEGRIILGMAYISMPLILLLTYIAFLGPLWSIHRFMADKRSEYEDDFAIRVENTQAAMLTYLDNGEIKKAETAKIELEILQALHPDRIKYPVWPFDFQVTLSFLIPQIFPIINLVRGDPFDTILEALSSIQDILSSH